MPVSYERQNVGRQRTCARRVSERERHALFQVLVGQASGSSANRPTSSSMDTLIHLLDAHNAYWNKLPLLVSQQFMNSTLSDRNSAPSVGVFFSLPMHSSFSFCKDQVSATSLPTAPASSYTFQCGCRIQIGLPFFLLFVLSSFTLRTLLEYQALERHCGFSFLSQARSVSEILSFL